MVRLKELLKAKTVGGRMRFNSTMVRLKDVLWDETIADLEGFNSTMVRLKGFSMYRFFVSLLQFQFHNGSIKSWERLICGELARWVSIPQWFD